jgi:hypothetical protein
LNASHCCGDPAQRQLDAMAGDVYHALIAEHGENPGSPQQWEAFKFKSRTGKGLERLPLLR